MNTFLFVVVLATLALLLFVLIAQKRNDSRGGFVERPRPRAPLNERQQAMYHRLVKTLPDLVVLPQVSFGALLTARTRAARSGFGRKIADFVICDRNFEVVAVVGLDEKAGRKERALREAHDALLVDAGYRVLRYARVPDVGRVEADFDPSLATPRLQIGPRFLEAMTLERPAFKPSTHQWHPSKAKRRRRERPRELPADQPSNAR